MSALCRERRRAHDTEPADEPATGGVAVLTAPATARVRLDRDQLLTTVGLVVLVVAALGFGLDVGLTALTVAVVLAVVSPARAKEAVGRISWSVVLLICGIVTYVGLMQAVGTVDYLGRLIGSAGSPLVAALLVCAIGAVVSAFASTTGILGALIPLAVPLMASGHVGAIGLVAALSISASVVVSSPFSTNGALVVANAGSDHQDRVCRQLMKWGMSLVVVAPGPKARKSVHDHTPIRSDDLCRGSRTGTRLDAGTTPVNSPPTRSNPRWTPPRSAKRHARWGGNCAGRYPTPTAPSANCTAPRSRRAR